MVSLLFTRDYILLTLQSENPVIDLRFSTAREEQQVVKTLARNRQYFSYLRLGLVPHLTFLSLHRTSLFTRQAE
jgi:hypothetical protein